MSETGGGIVQGRVSVVTPCFNAAPFVAETIESVLAQTHPQVEQIVVDDASTDGSWEVVQRYAALHPHRVRALRLESNRGGSHARNRGVELARGEFLMFLDADDTIAPDTLAALTETARERPGSIAVCDWVRLHEAGGAWVETAGEPLPEPETDVIRSWLEGTAFWPTCAALWDRTAYGRTGGWDEELTRDQDTDVALRAWAEGVRVVRAGGGAGRYRIHGDTRPSVRSGIAPSKLRSTMRVLQKLEARLARDKRMPHYSGTFGTLYLQMAAQGYQWGYVELARDCQRHGERLAGARVPDRTRLGRALTRFLGMERKERIARALAEVGIATSERRAAAREQRALRVE